jgi:ketosteroid isomerase-like protein
VILARVSQDSGAIVRALAERFQAAMSQGDVGAWFDSELVAQDAEFIPAVELAAMGSFRGREGMIEFMHAWTEGFERWSMRLEKVLYADRDRAVAQFHQLATGKGSGVSVENRFALIYELENGRVVRMRAYQDPAVAVEAARASAT